MNKISTRWEKISLNRDTIGLGTSKRPYRNDSSTRPEALDRIFRQARHIRLFLSTQIALVKVRVWEKNHLARSGAHRRIAAPGVGCLGSRNTYVRAICQSAAATVMDARTGTLYFVILVVKLLHDSEVKCQDNSSQ